LIEIVLHLEKLNERLDRLAVRIARLSDWLRERQRARS
jgi:hypothetical protein